MVPGQALDLWVCNYYKVLPTEDRFKRLGEEQKYLLFTGFLNQPLMDDIHRAHQSSRISVDGEAGENLKKLGYTDQQLARIKDQMEKAGI